MKQQLQVKINQSLVLSPKLRQGLDMLQLSNLELQQILTPLLNQNPFLVKEDPIEDRDISDNNEIIDMSWEDYTFAAYNTDDDKLIDFSDPYMGDQKHALLWQLNSHYFSDWDTMIAMAIIDSLDEHGYLTATNQELYEVLNEYLPNLNKADIENVRHKIMDIEPYGIASHNLQEFLAYQLIKTTPRSALQDLALELIDKEINAVAHFDLKLLAKETGSSRKELLAAIDLIRHLRARPWLHEVNIEVIPQPDLLLEKSHGKLSVKLNPHTLPNIYFDKNYYQEIANHIADKQFFITAYKEAQDVISNLSKRNQTLLKIAQNIVEYQTKYLTDTGALYPLDLHMISKTTNLHISTISRAIKNKLLATPTGVIELKALLSHSVSKVSIESADFVQGKIQDAISHENNQHPLSDQDIVNLLLQQHHLNIARRTVAKYRTQLGILPASLRRHSG